MGFHKDVEDYIAAFHVFAMSSQEEGLGSSVLDAFLYNVPVVGTDAGGLKDILADGRAIMVAKQNGKLLGEAINTLLTDRDRAKAIANKAHNYVINFHSRTYITQQYLELLGYNSDK